MAGYDEVTAARLAADVDDDAKDDEADDGDDLDHRGRALELAVAADAEQVDDDDGDESLSPEP